MIEIERIDDYLRVVYDDGSDWLFLPRRPPDRGYGVAGPDHVWTWDSANHLELFHTPTQRHHAGIELGPLAGLGQRPPLTVGPDGRLFVLQGVSPTESQLLIIDVAAGVVSGIHRGLPGALLSASPDGRSLVRFDARSLPTRDDSPGMIERLFRKPEIERRYGLTIQVCEADPLRFVRRIVVAWLTAKELPNETQLARMRNRPPSIPSRRVLWEIIAAAASGAGEPLEGAAPRSAYPPEVARDESAWQVIELNVDALVRQWIRIVGWQPDGSAFWADTNGFLTCVGLDGTVSPRLYTERRGLAPGTVRPVAASYRQIVPLPGRKARVIYADGEATFDGAPVTRRDQAVAIPPNRDGWRPRGGPDDPQERARSAAGQRVAELKSQARMIVVPLPAWTESECVRAIDALTRQVADGELHRRATGSLITIVFETTQETLPEARFFSEASADFPGIVPALRQVVDAFADASQGRQFLFADEEGSGALGRAVKALGVLDRSALPSVKRYGLLVDAEHEYFFAGDTVPAILAAHGWTDDVVDFVFWVLVRDYYNTLQNYREIWQSWGLRDAAVQRDPRMLARHLASELADVIGWVADPGRYGSGGLDKLAREIPQPHEPWAAAFFDELERLFARSNGWPARA